MRKYSFLFLWIVLIVPLFLFTSVQAADVTSVHWATRNDAPIPFVRVVLGLNEPTRAAVDISAKGTETTMTIENTKTVDLPDLIPMDPAIASPLQFQRSGKNLLVKVDTPKSLDVADVKVFTVPADEKADKPFRIVMDLKQKGVAPREYYYGKEKSIPKPKVESKSQSPATADPKTSSVKAEVKAPKTESGPAEDSNKDKQSMRSPFAAKSGYRLGGGIAGKLIVIDPGHGGSDPGAIGPNNIMEKNQTLPIAKYVKDDLEAAGAHVILTRYTDVDVYGPHASGVDELQARSDVGNDKGADMFISIHINSFNNPKVGGITTYYFDKTGHDEELGQAIQTQIAGEEGFGGDRGVQPANLYVLRHTTMPAVLVELGFISNPQEEALLTTDKTRRSLAKRIAQGIINYFRG